MESIIICAAEMERLFIIPGGRRLTGDFLRKRIIRVASYEDGIYEMTDGRTEREYSSGKRCVYGLEADRCGAGECAGNASINKFRYYIITTTHHSGDDAASGVTVLFPERYPNRSGELDESVKAYEAGAKPDIYIGGSSEIRHLGYSVQKSYEQIEALMEEIIRQQNERRKSELDALQSQINPHFLYNTLESITWMVEAQKNEEAVVMISELAKLLRVSLSKGKTIISIADELQHSRSYMNIQRVRYKERFKIEFHDR